MVFGVGIWGRGAQGETPKQLQSFSGAVLGWGLQGQHLGASPAPTSPQEGDFMEKGQ